MTPDKIMIIRHAEKPTPDGLILGVTEAGQQSPDELTVRGWQRAGALVRFLNPASGNFTVPALARPDTIFAAGAGEHKSLRPQHTVLPLSRMLGIALNVDRMKGDELDLVGDVLAAKGVVLISWQHEMIPTIANAIFGNATSCPQVWPGSRFDLVWVLDRGAAGWQLTQVPQLLLAGDRPEPIPNAE